MTRNTKPFASKVGAITIFVSDLARSRAYYGRFLRLEPRFEDDDATAYQIGETIVNLLKYEAAPELVEPQKMAKAGLRAVYTLPVSDVDAAVAALADAGMSPISGPIDRPWGIRTANFADPDGYVWELSSDIN